MNLVKLVRASVARALGLQERIDNLGRRLRVAQERSASMAPIVAWLPIIQQLEPHIASRALKHISGATSQIGQDLFALISSNFKTEGFFIEVGATDGVELSNTLILEKEFSWGGILVEPGRNWQPALKKNRSARIDSRAVWKNSGQNLPFIEASVLSSLKNIQANDGHQRSGKEYQVETVSPGDLLRDHAAPATVDFLSIDTEGSELTILESFPFDSYRVNTICVEHNFTPREKDIESLLESKGFVRVLRDTSSIDCWFVHRDSPSVELLSGLR